MNVTLIDHGAGNVTSVERALQRLGVEAVRATTPVEIERASVLLLPGVGHYSALVRALDALQLRAPILAAIERRVPFLGICLGLQALYEGSAEAADLPGLGVFPGRVQSLPAEVKLPHMGWNRVRALRQSRLFCGMDPHAYFYFAHSFAAPAAGPETVSACLHGSDFAAGVEKQNIFGTQFHPEKSGAAGAKLLTNFLDAAR